MVTRAEIGKRIRARRRELDLTQEELADLCGFGYQIISNLERGTQTVWAERLAVIATHLKVSADYLLGLPTTEDDPSELSPAIEALA